MTARLLGALDKVIRSAAFLTFEDDYETDARKVRAEIAGHFRTWPRANFAKGLVAIARAAHFGSSSRDALLAHVALVVNSKPFQVWATSTRGAKLDVEKLTDERAGTTRNPCSSLICRGLVDVCRVAYSIPVSPPPPPPPPPPTYVEVAPRVAYFDGASDARYCTVGQPGVVQDPNAPPGHTVDGVGATYDDNGLCKNGVRSNGPAATSALEIDGRPYCSLPFIGNPKDNSGSWAI